jgi:hypothetical protein
MSLSDKIRRLEEFIRSNPGLAGVPVFLVNGRPVSLSEALAMLRSNVNVPEVLSGLQSLGLDGEDTWVLAEEFWRRVASARPDISIMMLQPYVPTMSPMEALQHIRARDEIGTRLVQMYASMVNFVRARAGV